MEEINLCAASTAFTIFQTDDKFYELQTPRFECPEDNFRGQSTSRYRISHDRRTRFCRSLHGIEKFAVFTATGTMLQLETRLYAVFMAFRRARKGNLVDFSWTGEKGKEMVAIRTSSSISLRPYQRVDSRNSFPRIDEVSRNVIIHRVDARRACETGTRLKFHFPLPCKWKVRHDILQPLETS